MSRIALRPLRIFVPALLAGVILAAVAPGGVANALPPAGTDTVDVSGQISITSRTGQETVTLTGTATIQRAAPHMKGSVEAIDAEITALSLSGNSVTGPVTVTESPSLASNGEIRSLSDGSFPATSFFNVYAVVVVPASPSPSVTLYNQSGAPLVFGNGSLNGWPPYNAVYITAPNPCVLLLPSVSNPAQICVTGGVMTLSTAGVGGVTELAGIDQERETVDTEGAARRGAGIAVGLLLFATVGLAGWYARRKLRPER